MTSLDRLRWRLLSWVLDIICLVVFALTGVCALFSKRIRRDGLHAFTRNFWGTRGPSLDGRPVVWMHAVSVGEMRICQPLLGHLTRERPDLQFVLSIGTADAMSVARKELPTISLFYAPFDFSWAIRRIFNLLNPVALVIAENDFWAQMLNEAKRRDIPLAIFNTRMSPREQTEHRWNGRLLSPGLERAGWWGAVTEADAEWIRHFFDVTSPPLEVTGSLKFDGRLRDPRNPSTQNLRKEFGFTPDHQVLIAGSTHETEEKLIADIAGRLSIDFPSLRVVIAPRSVSRAGEVFNEIRREHPNVRLRRDGTETMNAPFITIIGSIGILQDLWGLADIAFVGGSFGRRGGQNMVEPASYGIPTCFGPHVWNFQPVVDQLLGAGAARQVQSEQELESTIREWLLNRDDAREIGTRALPVVKSQFQPLLRTLNGVLSILPPIVAQATSPSSSVPIGVHSCAAAEAS